MSDVNPSPDALLKEYEPFHILRVEYPKWLTSSRNRQWIAHSRSRPDIRGYGETALEALMELQMTIWEKRKSNDAL